MNKIILLHTNDIHGRVEGLARIATLVERIRAEQEGLPVRYLDLGDSEEYASRLSGLTKGAAMHRLLHAAGCQATVVGNAIMARHGPAAVTHEAEAVPYPHLLANVRYAGGRPVPGTQPAAMLQVGERKLGLIGVTAESSAYRRFFGLETLPPVPVIKEQAARLRAAGADAVILLSHLGIDTDRQVAAELDGEVALLLGGHSHTLLPEGEWVGGILMAHAGERAEHLGQVVLEWTPAGLRPLEASVLPVTEDIPPSPAVQTVAGRIEDELAQYLDEIICELPRSLALAFDRECVLGNLLADALRWRTGAQVALAVPGPTFTGGFPAGPLRRETLWARAPGTGNPGVVDLSGARLAALVARGLDPAFAADKPPSLRGQGRGLLHLSGAVVRDNRLLLDGRLPDPERVYRVAATDFELEPVWGYAEESWELAPRYEVEVIMREALAEYLGSGEAFPLAMGRLP